MEEAGLRVSAKALRQEKPLTALPEPVCVYSGKIRMGQ